MYQILITGFLCLICHIILPGACIILYSFICMHLIWFSNMGQGYIIVGNDLPILWMGWISEKNTSLSKVSAHTCSVKNKEQNLQVSRTSYFSDLLSFQMFTGSLFRIKILHLRRTFSCSGFQSSQLSKTVPGKFHGSVGHSKRHCLQDRSNF